MEVLTFAGLPTVLFLDRRPTAETRAASPGYRGIGIAGICARRRPRMDGRSTCRRSSQRSRRSVRRSFTTRSARPSIRADTSARSAGRSTSALPARRRATGSRSIVGAPGCGAIRPSAICSRRLDGGGYRLDRHPTMARHPGDADGRGRLCGCIWRAQTDRPSASSTWLRSRRGTGAEVLDRRSARGPTSCSIDVLDEETLRAGRRAWSGHERGDEVFAVGSQGVRICADRLLAQPGPAARKPGRAPTRGPVDRLAGGLGHLLPGHGRGRSRWAEAMASCRSGSIRQRATRPARLAAARSRAA